MREIVPGIFTWPWFSERHGYDFNGWFVRAREGNVVVDPPEMSEEDLDWLAGKDLVAIVLTNRNHGRASAVLRERTGVRVFLHPADTEHARKQGMIIDRPLAVGDRIGPFAVVDASGKSPGEVALHWAERRILVVGDACIGKPAGACALLPEHVIDDLGRLKQSLRRLVEELDFETLLVGDGAPILTGGREALRRLVTSFAS